MSDIRERLEGVLRAPTKSVDDAERAAQAAEALASYLRLEERVRQIFEDDTEMERNSGAGMAEADSLRGKTLHKAAEIVLMQAGVPLHARELGKRIKGGGWTHKRSINPKPDQILYQLAARLPRHPETFVRVAPNTFGLTKWPKKPNGNRKPRTGIFRGGGKPLGKEIGDHPHSPPGSRPWRSS
jgi:HB1, ASXL, restriction endonuclease HTH domain